MGAKIPQEPPPKSGKPEHVPPPPPKKGRDRQQRIEELEAALREIAESKFCQYPNDSTMYGIGVTDGHRYCAKIARDALAN